LACAAGELSIIAFMTCDARKLITVGDSQPRATDAVQLASWTMLTNELMNLDEVLCK
jgi:hypothetical protein